MGNRNLVESSIHTPFQRGRTELTEVKLITSDFINGAPLPIVRIPNSEQRMIAGVISPNTE
ncbi:hypothetical protein N7474_004660 [Penicillium riverlandense]|uniref:uncharacterized protein n=1 Tax=Penicillium riverlandense TaxID=1903569 RepID=UPI00254696B1|nr:uncharacterized protein N7474_004660 [Penicillium riverlandense]KAJ5819069.1 hypothetical protein N7474_004660 [Penicillium riverlandense]